MTLLVRRALNEDLVSVADLHRRAFSDYAVSSWAVGQSAFIAVATLDGAFAGFGLSERVGEPASLDRVVALPPGTTPELEVAPTDTILSAVAVQPELRRRGVGRALVEARVREAREHGSVRVFAHCVAGTGSVPLYAALGFESIVTVPGYFENGRAMTLMVQLLAGR